MIGKITIITGYYFTCGKVFCLQFYTVGCQNSLALALVSQGCLSRPSMLLLLGLHHKWQYGYFAVEAHPLEGLIYCCFLTLNGRSGLFVPKAIRKAKGNSPRSNGVSASSDIACSISTAFNGLPY